MERIRPEVELVGVLGNRFNLVRPCMAALEKSGQRDLALDLLCEVTDASSNAEALTIMSDYVNITSMGM